MDSMVRIANRMEMRSETADIFFDVVTLVMKNKTNDISAGVGFILSKVTGFINEDA